MSRVTLDAVLRSLRALVPENADPRPDAELLLCFVHRHDESAFLALIQRHGPMVLNVCRGGVRHEQDAEDAFQATFLALAAKARSLRQPGAVASWLHEVAQRIATPKVQLYAAFVAFSPDGKTFAWCGHDEDGRVSFHVADAATGKEVRRIDNEVLRQVEDTDSRFDHVSTIGGSIGFSAFTPDGKALVFALNQQVFLWSLDPSRKLLRFGTDTPLRVRAAALSSDGKTLASGNKEGTVCLWEVATMKQRVRFQAHEGAGREGNMGGVASLAWSRDGNVLVSGGEDTSILVWDVTTPMGQGRSRPADLTPREPKGCGGPGW